MDKAELITTILSVPAEHLYGVSFDEIVERIGKTEQDKLNQAIISAIKHFFKYGDKGKNYQYLEEPWFADIKKSKIPLNAIVIKTGLLESLKGYYSGYPNEKLEDAVGKLHTYMISQLTADSRAAAFIKALEAEAQEQKERKTQDKRDRQAKDTNDTVHKTHDDVQDIKQMLTEKNSPVPSQPPVAPQTQADNQDYLEHFYDPLFLEDDGDSAVTLDSMYVSPHIKTVGDKEISAAECIMQWFHSRNRNTCMLLFGNAGVGKSSLVSKIIADANPDYYEKTSSQEFYFSQEQVLAVALREHLDDIDMEKKGDKILLDLFRGYTPDALREKLLILDGLDEVCVLRQEFNGFMFLNKMSQLKSGFHVLVTSRDAKDYFDDPKDIIGIRIENLRWGKDEVKTWCQKYSTAKPEKDLWCRDFYEKFKKLNQEDHRREIFCVPIILYICGDSGINLSDHNSVGSIYDDAFRKILLRKYLRGQGDYTSLTEADRQSNLIAWQYTKELAYQMFLLDTLDLVDSNDPENKHAVGLKHAQKRTKTVLQEQFGSDFDVPDDALEIKKELALCPFTKGNATGGITFAHKTVCEYFTAVKLYEDYFSKFNKSYFGTKNADEAAEDVIRTAVAAFRYHKIPEEVFQYLCDMNEAPYSGISSEGFDADGFKTAFVHAMENGVFDILILKEEDAPKKEYIDRTVTRGIRNPLHAQIGRAFLALLCFVTGHGFQNKDDNVFCKRIRELLGSSDQIVNLKQWNLQDADLHQADLKGADLQEANLQDAELQEADLQEARLREANLQEARLYWANLQFVNLREANLQEAILCWADLQKANLQGANLRRASLLEANLQGADLQGADLQGADLQGANLQGANLRGVKYCTHPDEKTIFPDGFDPKKHDMIEVDENGDLV